MVKRITGPYFNLPSKILSVDRQPEAVIDIWTILINRTKYMLEVLETCTGVAKEY